MKALLALAAVLLLAAGCGSETTDEAAPPADTTTAPAPAAPPPPDARQAPRVAGVTLDGKRISLEEFRGKPVFVNVWSSW